MSVQATFCATLVDEWVAGGVTEAVICPGSRSTPLALALAERLRVHVRIDERSAGFYALGLAMATGRPTVVCTTSGTAAAELHAAVVEAHHGLVPLIACTADRPPELQDVGASQTIDQVGLYTSATRWSASPGVPTIETMNTWRPLAVRALSEALHGPHGPGPVHLNLAFREPLLGTAHPLPASGPRSNHRLAVETAAQPQLDPPLPSRGLIIAGAGATPSPHQLVTSARSLGWPLLADPRSGARLPGTVAAADAIVRTGAAPLPECVLLLGMPWLSKALAEYVSTAATAGCRVIAVDPYWRWSDPTRVVTEFHHVDPDTFITGAPSASPAPDAAWLELWDDCEAKAQAAIDDTLGNDLNEPALARRTAAAASLHNAAVFVSASMPMRDLEWFAPTHTRPPAVYSNRGANGIDGVVSTALGLAAAPPITARRPVLALLGDVAFLHDVSGLVNLSEDVPCTFIVPDNAGGGIFSFLPQAAAVPDQTFERLFGTPPTSDIGRVAAGFGLPVKEVTTIPELDDALAQPSTAPQLIRVRVPDRAANVATHDALNQAVRHALTQT